MLAEIKALEGVTFTPALSKESRRGAYADIRPRVNMRQVCLGLQQRRAGRGVQPPVMTACW